MKTQPSEGKVRGDTNLSGKSHIRIWFITRKIRKSITLPAKTLRRCSPDLCITMILHIRSEEKVRGDTNLSRKKRFVKTQPSEERFVETRTLAAKAIKLAINK